MPTEATNFNRYANPGSRPIENMGHTTPDIEFSDSERPAVPFVPAPYLPAGRFDEHKRANIVLSAGTPVALDVAGSMIPAGTPVGHAFKYTSLDRRTGLPAVKLAADGVAVTADATSIMNSGLGNDRNGHFLEPVGVVSYNAYQFEGAVEGTWPDYTVDYDNPSKFPIHQTQAQPETLVAITCDYTLEMPYLWGLNLLSDEVKIFDNTANEVPLLSADAKSYPFAHDELVRASGGDVASGLNLVFISPANGGGDTGLVGSGAIGGTAEALTWRGGGEASAGTAVNVSAPGYHIIRAATDATKYIVVFNNGEDVPAVATGQTVFGGAPTLQPGDFVCARLGKFVKFDDTRMAEGDRLGQVLRVRASNIKRDYLDRVKTAYDRSADPTHRMAGSATRGVPYLLSLVSDAAQVQLETQKTLAGATLTAAGLPSTLPLGSIVVNLLR